MIEVRFPTKVPLICLDQIGQSDFGKYKVTPNDTAKDVEKTSLRQRQEILASKEGPERHMHAMKPSK